MAVPSLLVLVAHTLFIIQHVEVGVGALVTREAGLGQHLQHLQQAVPVIHLDPGKATVDDYLRMFPDKFLGPNKSIKPIDVRKIEHEDFIDYEIEFVELSDDVSDEADDNSEFILKQTESSDSHSKPIVNLNKVQDESFSEDSREVNLVNFADLFRKSRTKSRSRAAGDIRRRRRIKLKRDPARSRSREINDSSNQINTSEQSKRVENNFSHNIFSKSRTVIRNHAQTPPETDRKATILDRRTLPTLRASNYRSRKRIPLKFGRSFNHDDRPSEQQIRLKNPSIISKLERSNSFERNVIKSTDKSTDDLVDKISVQHQTEGEHVTQSTMFPTTALSTTTQHSDVENNIVVVESDLNMPVDMPEIQAQSKLITEETLSLPTTPSQTGAIKHTVTTKTSQTSVTQDPSNFNERVNTPSLSESIEPLRSTTTTSTTSSSYENMASITTQPLMMYPEVFTQLPAISQTVRPTTTSPPPLPLHLLSVFGSRPRSSRLRVVGTRHQAPVSGSDVTWSQSSTRDQGIITRPGLVSVFSQQQLSTVSSAFKFSIISTSTETSAPLFEVSTESVTDHQLNLHKNRRVLPEQSAAKTSTKSTTISLPATTTPSGAKEISATTTAAEDNTNVMSDAVTRLPHVPHDTTTHKNEFEFEGITTMAGVESIMNDNQMMTTPIPEDLQLSESITSVYLHNSSQVASLILNIKTTQTPKMDPVNSITLLPFSKLTNQILDSERKDSSTKSRQVTSTTKSSPTTATSTSTSVSSNDKIFTVTPVSVSKTTTMMQYNDMSGAPSDNDHNDDQDDYVTTTLSDMYSGQYHEENPGQYHEVNPGQYHEINPGQYHEINPGQYHEVNPGQYDEVNPGQYQRVKYQNLESSYPGDYEVNEVKVDFDNRDEHKIYNVQAKAGDFIIGEVGKIDVNNGQTVEGVRYTALDGEVDPLKIAEILNRYFGTRTS